MAAAVSASDGVDTAVLQIDFPVAPVIESVFAGRKRTLNMFYASNRLSLPEFPDATRVRVASKLIDDYGSIAMPVKASIVKGEMQVVSKATPLLLTDAAATTSRPSAAGSSSGVLASAVNAASVPSSTDIVLSSAASVVEDVVRTISARHQPKGVSADSAVEYEKVERLTEKAQTTSRAMVARRAPGKVPEPKWHAPWKIMRVISGHLGWVRCIAVEPGNEWFATGSADRTIKIWDLASGTLRVTLTGHINTVRALAVSARHPYLFSAAEDKMVKCWDLETNKAIRHYHGHLSGVYSMALHPTLDLLFTGGRDSVCRVWDMRTQAPIHVLSGHENTIGSILANSVDPQVITGSMDNTIRLWDLAAGKVRTVLTHHKKSIRGLASHPREFCFLSGAADNLKKWALPDGVFVQNFAGHNSIINSVAVNDDDVVVSGGDDGTMRFWDYNTGYGFQETATKVQPGSLESEAGILSMAFDVTGSRLFTTEADKSIKVWKEDPDASPETHPIDMKAWTDYYRSHKKY